MKVEILGAYGGSTDTSFLTSFLIDDFLALDAGCLTQTLNLDGQVKVTDILISHTHLDHTLSLGFLVDNMFGLRDEPLKIWSGKAMIEAMQQHIFNEVIWPDFTQLPNAEEATMAFREVLPEITFSVRHLRITAVPVNHVVPCFAYFVASTETGGCILYTADTSTTDRVWQVANEIDRLDAVIVDCSFPNHMDDLAIASGHMTPAMLAADLKKLKRDCKIMIYHIKPMFEDQMIAELTALNIPNIDMGIQGKTYHF
ncbi:3',5'-cyclic-nucleotide phosphodiesterase [Acanthopleuribacter pedis]|uniref:3',5'-cyclic-nucleotide phosphodiesterase n=1 Tax=Acanthopleuribacter pedis TaxID=442870 RepID=A0A8J7Q7C0_9BACT|nr:3',5'-cyclic-nucleotide phosphodiesterase [Acanthopleuribacter pedis]MBO1318124.1 3',5'-cyclic-nucleotide phosphodiesterase [Acanthopleuribacter pedis]